MKREFVLNLTFLIMINLLIKPLYIFGIDVGVQNASGPEAYGLYFYLMGFIYLFQVINDLGIQNFNNRFISLNEQLLGKYFPHIFSLKISLGLVFFTVVIASGLAFGLVELHALLFLVIAFNLFLDSLNGYLRSNVAGLAWYRTDSLLSVADKMVMILLVGWLLLRHEESEDFPIIWFAISQTVSFLSVTIIGLFLLRKKLPRLIRLPDRKYFFLVFKKSWPFALILFSTFIYNRLDGVMIGFMLEEGEREAGYYAAGFRLYDAVSMFTFLFVGLLYPMFSKMLSRGENPAALYVFGLKLLWAAVLAVLLLLMIFADEIMNGLYSDAGPDAASVLSLLALAFAAKSVFHISGSLMLSYGDLKRINLIFGSGVILNFILNLWLIPAMGIIGACWATLITQALVALFLYLQTIELTSGKAGYRLLTGGLLLLFAVLMIALSLQFWDIIDFWSKAYALIASYLVLGWFILRQFVKNGELLIKWWRQ